MKAAMFYGKEDLRIEDVPEPEVGPGQVKIRNGYVGICGGDVHTYFHPEASPVDLFRPHPVTGAQLPQPLGHEFSGTVVEVGEGVTGIEVGDRGSIFPTAYSCGKCTACRHGRPTSCRLMAGLGANANGGGMAEFVAIDARQFHRLPEDVDLQRGALVEPMSVAWHGAGRSRSGPGDVVLVAGAGPVGIGAWYAFRARGVENILVSEPSGERRSKVAVLGARVIDPVTEDLDAAVADLTGGDGVDVFYDAAGAGAALRTGLANLAPGGRVVLQSGHEKPFEIEPNEIMMGEYELLGSLGYRPDEFDGVIGRMSAGEYDTTGWVEEMELDDVVEAIHKLRAGAGTKILLRVG
ncbi:alcohol dehydrogenase catalytic domain-containing protein [Streptomyces sp. NPDC015350]|uniref:alcohol dehydrogenase catalytic domain-containing protein n=1 Tax=Streptomyces sp. NPDC015350 TaxID=3364955 RepID=UPI0036F745B4